MKTLESYIDIKNIDKSDWKVYKFEKIAKSIGERVEPTNTDLEIYVGLEHLDSDSIHIKRYGKKDDVSGTKLRCYPGDVIFGRRRAYQRKAAIVEFDGFCSAHSLVLRANPDVIDPRLFPFFLHSDTFMHRAIDISVGSLSPTINWGTLKNEEFLLPPKDQQARLAELLWAADEVVESEGKLLMGLRRAYQTALDQYMIHGVHSSKGARVKKSKCGLMNENIFVGQLKECLLEKPSYGANASAKPYLPEAPRYIRITDIDENGNLISGDIATIDSNDYEDYVLKEGDFLFARTGNTVGKTYLHKSENGYSVYAGYLIRFRVDPKVLNPKFLFYFTKSIKFDSFKREMIKVGAQPNINAEEYQSMYLPLLSIHDQMHIVDKLDAINERIKLTEERIISSKQLQKSLINQIF